MDTLNELHETLTIMLELVDTQNVKIKHLETVVVYLHNEIEVLKGNPSPVKEVAKKLTSTTSDLEI